MLFRCWSLLDEYPTDRESFIRADGPSQAAVAWARTSMTLIPKHDDCRFSVCVQRADQPWKQPWRFTVTGEWSTKLAVRWIREEGES